MSTLVGVDIKGMDELIHKLSQIGDARKTRRALISIHRPVLRPVVAAAKREAPKRSSVIMSGPRAGKKQSQNNKFGPSPNLKKAIGIIVGKGNPNINMYVGPRAGSKRKNDGWYARLIHYGFKAGGRTTVPANPFMDRASRQTVPGAQKKALNMAAKQIDKQIKKLSK